MLRIDKQGKLVNNLLQDPIAIKLVIAWGIKAKNKNQYSTVKIERHQGRKWNTKYNFTHIRKPLCGFIRTFLVSETVSWFV